MPSSAHAARTPGSGRPPWSRCGGEATAIEPTPAICAGTTFITTLESSGANPPGTYSPTRRTGSQRSVTVPPGTTWVVTSVRRWSACTFRTRAIDSSSATRRVGSHSARARSSAAWGTAKSSRSTPSSRAVISRTAWAPRSRTSSQSGRTVARTESMSVAARGSRPASSRAGGNADPRRSMRASTGYTSGVGRRTSRVASAPEPPARHLPPGDRRLGTVGELIPLFPLGSPLFPGVVLPLSIFEPRYRRLVQDLIALPAGSPQRFFGVVAIRQGWEVEQVSPAEALYDVGCSARLQAVRSEPDGRFRITTVGADRFRLLDVVVGEDPPYLQGEVEWLAEEEAAEEAAGDAEGLVGPAGDDVAAEVARSSLAVVVRGVRDLFTRYVAEVAALRGGGWAPGGDEALAPAPAAPAGGPALSVGAQTAELLRAVADDPRALSWLVAAAALLTTDDRQALLAISATRRRLAAESRLLRRELTILRPLGAVPVPLQEFATPMTVN